MTITVDTLAERTLRRIGVTVVPLDDRPTLTEMVPVATIATMALVELGVIAADEVPAPLDQALMLDKVASVQAALGAQAVVTWDSSVVPRAYTEEYTKLVAATAGSSFGKQIDPAMVALLEARVRKGAMVVASHDLAVEAVMAVHNDWAARDLVRWTTFDLPDYAAMAYEMAAAYLLADKFGAQANANDLMLAERTIARITALPTSGAHVVAEYF